MSLSKSIVYSYKVNPSRIAKSSEYSRCDDLVSVISNFYTRNKVQLNKEDSIQILTILNRIEKHGCIVKEHVKQEMFQEFRTLQKKYFGHMR